MIISNNKNIIIKRKSTKGKKRLKIARQRYSSLVEHVPSISKALSLMPRIMIITNKRITM